MKKEEFLDTDKLKKGSKEAERNIYNVGVRALYSSFYNHKEGSWVMLPKNAWQLYQFVKHGNVKKILDLGTGIGLSSALMSLAMKDGKRKGEIHTVEQFKKCYDLAQKLIPDDLKECITFYHTPQKLWENKKIPYIKFSIFETLPDGDFDLILTDGPGPWFEGEGKNRKFIELPNGDVMKMLMENKLKTGTLAAWDGRVGSISLIERYYGNNFYLVYQGQDNHFNVLERRNNKLDFEDMRKVSMLEQGYDS